MTFSATKDSNVKKTKNTWSAVFRHMSLTIRFQSFLDAVKSSKTFIVVSAVLKIRHIPMSRHGQLGQKHWQNRAKLGKNEAWFPKDVVKLPKPLPKPLPLAHAPGICHDGCGSITAWKQWNHFNFLDPYGITLAMVAARDSEFFI